MTCYSFSVQLPTARELLQSQFIREAKETCGLEDVFSLYWKVKIKKDQELYGMLNAELDSDEPGRLGQW